MDVSLKYFGELNGKLGIVSSKVQTSISDTLNSRYQYIIKEY